MVINTRNTIPVPLIPGALHDIYGIPIGFLADALQVVGEHSVEKKEKIISDFKIPLEKLSDAGNRVSSSEYYAVLDYILEHLDIQGFGLLQASTERMTDYGPMGIAFVSSENLRMVIEIGVVYRRLFGPASEYFANFTKKRAVISCLGVDNPLRYHWSIENVLAGWANIIRYCLGDAARFIEVKVTYPKPKYSELYEKIFNCPIHFNQESNELRFPPSLLNIPLTTANAGLRELCVRQCENALTKMSKDEHLIDQIEGIILSGVGRIPSLHTVAKSLHMSPRSLHRRLVKLDTSYRQIVERLQRRLVNEYLTETNLDLKEISFLLGYSELANFHHAFRRWFGCTPQQYREKERTKA